MQKNSAKQFQTLFKFSLLSALIGIFLLPNLAYLSSITSEEIINITNEERQKAGLNSLTANQLLTQAAAAKGDAILRSQTFQHSIKGRKFSSWIRDAGYNYSYVGENLAIDFETSKTVVEAWKNSPSHKKNLLSPYYEEIGIAAIDGKFQGQNTTVVVQMFGAPAISSISPLSQNAPQGLIEASAVFPEIDSTALQVAQTENLLTHSILNQKLLAGRENKIVAQFKNDKIAEANKFIVQSEYDSAVNHFFVIFISLAIIYLLALLHFYYFSKINKLASL